MNDKYQNLCILDDLVFSNKKYQHFLRKAEKRIHLVLFHIGIFL